MKYRCCETVKFNKKLTSSVVVIVVFAEKVQFLVSGQDSKTIFFNFTKRLL